MPMIIIPKKPNDQLGNNLFEWWLESSKNKDTYDPFCDWIVVLFLIAIVFLIFLLVLSA